MKPFIINKSSWHYKLIRRYWDHNPMNFCDYIKMLVGSLIVTGILAFFVALIAWLPIDFFYWLYLLALPGPGKVIIGVPGFMFISCGIVLCGCIGINKLGGLYKARQREKLLAIGRGKIPPEQPKQPGFIKTWYQTARHKYCIPVQYTNNKERK